MFFTIFKKEKCFSRKKKKAVLNYKNKDLDKSKNWDFFKGVNPRFPSKSSKIFQCFRFSKINQETVFKDTLGKKQAFVDYKNKGFKTSRNWTFSKAVSPWFWSKN